MHHQKQKAMQQPGKTRGLYLRCRRLLFFLLLPPPLPPDTFAAGPFGITGASAGRVRFSTDLRSALARSSAIFSASLLLMILLSP